MLYIQNPVQNGSISLIFAQKSYIVEYGSGLELYIMDAKHVTILCISVICSVLSFLSSITNLALIKSMGKWNGYLAIIWYMRSV